MFAAAQPAEDRYSLHALLLFICFLSLGCRVKQVQHVIIVSWLGPDLGTNDRTLATGYMQSVVLEWPMEHIPHGQRS